MAKDLNPTPELPPGRAMHSNAGEKSDRVGPGPPGTELGFAEPSWKDRVKSSTSFQAPLLNALGTKVPSQAPTWVRVTPDVHSWTCGGSSPEQPLLQPRDPLPR